MTRLDRLRNRLARDGHDGVLLSSLENIRWLTGYTGHAANVIAAAAGCWLITDYRYFEQAQAECAGCEVIKRDRPTTTLGQSFEAVFAAHGLRRVAFEQDVVTFGQHREVAADITTAELVPVSGLVEELRYVKDDKEIAALKRAAGVADEALARVFADVLRAGVTEQEVAWKLEEFMRDLGSEEPAFDTILLSGPRSSLPHGVPTDRVIGDGELVLFDFGATIDGYRSDMTRTVVVGEPDEKQREIHAVVLEAQQAGVAAVKAGVTGRVPYEASRMALEKSPWIEYAGEGLGHGVGLQMHEQPFMDGHCDRVLEPGCVVTVEPGIYIPGWGGIRIEDDVVVTQEGCEVVSRTGRGLMEGGLA